MSIISVLNLLSIVS